MTQRLHSSEPEKLATLVSCAQLDIDPTQLPVSADQSQFADVPIESQKTDGLVSHAQTDMSHHPTEDNVSQLLALNLTQSSEMPLHATCVFHANQDGSQMPCRESVLDRDQSVLVLRSITHKTNTNVSNVQLTKLLMPVILSVLIPPVPKITTTLDHQLNAMHAENAQVDSTQTHKEEPAIDSLPLLVPVDKDSPKMVTHVSTAQ